MRIIGLISGTSHDGIDGVLAEFDSMDDVLRAKIIKSAEKQYDHKTRERILAALPPNQVALEEVCKLDTQIGKEFAELASELSQLASPDLVVSHGQTVYHWVEGDKAHGTLQLGQPAWISRATSAPVLFDLRSSDIALGGQGAPIVPILDLLVLNESESCVGSLNLGGIANITVIRNGEIAAAFDTGPASALIDAAVLKYSLHPKGYDVSGEIAARGKISPELLAVLLADGYYQLKPPKSTGKELFHLGYLNHALDVAAVDLSPEDVLATLTELTAQTVADALQQHQVETLVVGGGGANNRTLIDAITRKTALDPRPFGDYGVPGDLKEAFAMALIGWLSLNNLPATLPSTTGASAPAVLGAIAPGETGFPEVRSSGVMPKKLVIETIG
jgi:anhydro-N-acetylmuramic acid kinase